MHRSLAALVLALSLALPARASAAEFMDWDAVKETWEYRPWALFLAAPAFVATLPFFFGTWVYNSLTEEDAEDDEG